MTYKLFCDRCNQEIQDNNFVKVEYRENDKYRWGHYHVDCFNYEFSTDIRQIKVDKAEGVHKDD